MPSTFTSKAMWKAVGYVLILHALADIASHLLWQNIHLDLPDEILNPTSEDGKSANREFWLKSLPQNMLLSILSTPINYKWYCWLESMFPGRRGSTRMPSPRQEREKAEIDSDDELEEKIMRKLIAKGKVQRSGLSWFNTFVKWMLDTVLANFFFICLCAFYFDLVNWKPLSETWSTLKITIIPVFLLCVFSFNTFVSLIAFIAIPVQHRLPFEAAGGLAWRVFIGAFVNVLAPWAMGLQIVKDGVGNYTESIRAAQNGSASTTTMLIDESRLIGDL